MLDKNALFRVIARRGRIKIQFGALAPSGGRDAGAIADQRRGLKCVLTADPLTIAPMRLTKTPIELFQTAAARAAVAACLLAACSPTFNWREVRPDETRLALLLPCKPDKAEKTVPLGGRPTPLRLLGCDAGGATFAVAVADLGDAARVAGVLAQWQALTLANMKAGAPLATPLMLKGAAASPAPVLVKAQGQRADGTAVSGQAAYFAQGAQVFQAVVYAENLSPEVAETFFGSLSFE